MKNSTMRLNETEREEFRKRVNIFIPQMKKSEGYPLEGQSTTKRKLVTQPPGHLPVRIS